MPKPEHPDEHEIPISTLDLSRRLHRIFPLLGRLWELDIRVRDEMSPVHFHALARLSQRAYSLNELAEQLSVSSASLSRTVNVLEDRGWVMRNRDEVDRRVVNLSITEMGMNVLHDVSAHTERQLAQVFEALDQAERAHLRIALDRLIHVIDDFILAQQGRQPPAE